MLHLQKIGGGDGVEGHVQAWNMHAVASLARSPRLMKQVMNKVKAQIASQQSGTSQRKPCQSSL